MGVVRRAEVILMITVGISHRRVGQRLQVETIRPHYPQGQQAVNILASGTVWLTGFGIAATLPDPFLLVIFLRPWRTLGGTNSRPLVSRFILLSSQLPRFPNEAEHDFLLEPSRTLAHGVLPNSCDS
jgi:hypothetical protein